MAQKRFGNIGLDGFGILFVKVAFGLVFTFPVNFVLLSFPGFPGITA